MTEHAVVIVGGGPTGLMLAGELALAGVDVAIVERGASQDLTGLRAGGLHSRTIEILDQRGIADRFLSEGTMPARYVPYRAASGRCSSVAQHNGAGRAAPHR
jgi:2-polyprenyl-6-methoxyphenol hydroxylase-like FAD-dependent oxidoreductase